MYNVEAGSSPSVVDAVPLSQPDAGSAPVTKSPAARRRWLTFLPAATKEQSKDTGMALVLICLLLLLTRKQEVYLYAALALHVVNMTAPQLFRPAAVVWFALSHLLGTVTSRILLTAVFFVIVTPLGWFRRVVMRADTLQLRGFKQSRDSVMHTRNHTFTGKDIEHPF
jgi:hypothetical protein